MKALYSEIIFKVSGDQYCDQIPFKSANTPFISQSIQTFNETEVSIATPTHISFSKFANIEETQIGENDGTTSNVFIIKTGTYNMLELKFILEKYFQFFTVSIEPKSGVFTGQLTFTPKNNLKIHSIQIASISLACQLGFISPSAAPFFNIGQDFNFPIADTGRTLDVNLIG